MNKRASLELSVNFLVMLIISIVVFGFGIYFLTQTGAGLSKASEEISREAETQIEALLDSGEQIIIYPEELEIKKGQTDVFGVGILNTVRMSKTEFIIGVWPNAYINLRGETFDCTQGECPAVLEEWTYGTDFPVETLEPNENVKINVPVQVKGDISPGVYIFDVLICQKRPEGNFPTISDDNGNENYLCSRETRLDHEIEYPSQGFLKFRVVVP
ncbi:MAG: hypothetical protein ACLFPQ_01210 [Candidatus Woesearchaeota archaeon]